MSTVLPGYSLEAQSYYFVLVTSMTKQKTLVHKNPSNGSNSTIFNWPCCGHNYLEKNTVLLNILFIDYLSWKMLLLKEYTKQIVKYNHINTNYKHSFGISWCESLIIVTKT